MLGVETRRFPILYQDMERPRDWPANLPWGLVEPHEKRALLNHNQDLETLASRGGLSVEELYCLFKDISWREFKKLGLSAKECVKVVELVLYQYIIAKAEALRATRH